MRTSREKSRRPTAAGTFSWTYPSPASAADLARAYGICVCGCVHVYVGVLRVLYHTTGGGSSSSLTARVPFAGSGASCRKALGVE